MDLVNRPKFGPFFLLLLGSARSVCPVYPTWPARWSQACLGPIRLGRPGLIPSLNPKWPKFPLGPLHPALSPFFLFRPSSARLPRGANRPSPQAESPRLLLLCSDFHSSRLARRNAAETSPYDGARRRRPYRADAPLFLMWPTRLGAKAGSPWIGSCAASFPGSARGASRAVAVLRHGTGDARRAVVSGLIGQVVVDS